MLVSKSKEDKGTGMVSLKQDREGAFHVLVHMISEALCRGDGILAALESQATRFVRFPLGSLTVFAYLIMKPAITGVQILSS